VIVVSNSSPLVALARIGRLALLASFYKRILIPAEVHHEVTVAGRGLPGAEEVRNANWIEVISQKAPGHPSLAQVCQGLGAGALPFSWPRAWKPILFCWTSGKPVGWRKMRVFPWWAVWEYSRRVPGGASSQTCVRYTWTFCNRGSDSTLGSFKTA
jgi:hypothetical protein